MNARVRARRDNPMRPGTIGAAMQHKQSRGERAREIYVFQPGLGTVPEDGAIALEGPHYPEPHRWYATGTMKAGELVAVK